MSVQILLYGKLLGIEEFLLSPSPVSVEPEQQLIAGRSHWITLLSEILPRALLAELGLSRLLLGSSGSGAFLLVLPIELRVAAEEFLATAGRDLGKLSGGYLQLVCGVTENLGDWSVVRKRLMEDLRRKAGSTLRSGDQSAFAPAGVPEPDGAFEYFSGLGTGMWQTQTVGWSPEVPARILTAPGKHSWSLIPNRGGDDIQIARHAAPSDGDALPANLDELAARAEGRKTWAVLRGDVDSVRIRLRRAQTIEEHVKLSVVYKQFFAGELELLCSQPEFWRKTTILYSGGDDFAVYGAWDALIPLAREIQRLFHRFTEENLKDFPGPEGKTISMAIALAPEPNGPFGPLYLEAGRRLETAKSIDKDCISLMGRTLEWRHLSDAADLKDTLARMVREFGSSRHFLYELSSFYRKGNQFAAGAGTPQQFDKPWRFQRRLNRILSGARDREVQKLRSHLANEMMGKGAAQVKLRPAGLVALEWARLFTEV
jgi:CRISPR-associated protein Csm1